MINMKKICIEVLVVFLGLASQVNTAEIQGRMTIQANAVGTSTQLGRTYSVTIYIEEYSTQGDQDALIEAFSNSGQDGLVTVLENMKPKGYVRLSSGTVGVNNDVKYIVELPSDGGRRLRLVTDRDIAFVEETRRTRSKDYSVGAIEIILTPDGKGSTGTMLPAVKLTVDKKTRQIEAETYQNPWNLINFTIHND